MKLEKPDLTDLRDDVEEGMAKAVEEWWDILSSFPDSEFAREQFIKHKNLFLSYRGGCLDKEWMEILSVWYGRKKERSDALDMLLSFLTEMGFDCPPKEGVKLVCDAVREALSE